MLVDPCLQNIPIELCVSGFLGNMIPSSCWSHGGKGNHVFTFLPWCSSPWNIERENKGDLGYFLVLCERNARVDGEPQNDMHMLHSSSPHMWHIWLCDRPLLAKGEVVFLCWWHFLLFLAFHLGGKWLFGIDSLFPFLIIPKKSHWHARYLGDKWFIEPDHQTSFIFNEKTKIFLLLVFFPCFIFL